MRATSIGHAGILIESDRGSIVCDPWFVPAFLGSWFPFPRNDQLDDDLLARIEARRLPVRLAPPRRSLGRAVAARAPPPRHRRPPARLPDARARPPDARPRLHEPHPHDRPRGARPRRRSSSPSTSRPASPTGQAATRRSSSATARARLVDQNDCRTTDLDALRAHGPVDLHWLQYSGAIWYPMVYDVPADEMRDRSCGPRSTASWPGRCATSRRSAPGPSCRAPGRRASSTRSCSTST